jgi:hypothetical protein
MPELDIVHLIRSNDMTLRKKAPRAKERWITLGFAVFAASLLMASAVMANLTGSGFDAGDGNLLVNDEAKDWANVGIDCTSTPKVGCAIDKDTGTSDDSFGQGTKEDTPVPSVVDGSIPNNKSDLLRFYVANEKASGGPADGDEFLYLAWERVQEPTGTTNMDFEFNQSSTLSSNGVTPVRTAYDVLIKYDLAQGGTNPQLGYHVWVTAASAAADPDIPNTAGAACEASNSFPCWGAVQSLAGAFEGSINSVAVDDPINPGATRSLSARTFGEAAINLTDGDILPGGGDCFGFGSAYLKSRSSDSFTSAVKDFIAPIPVNISNCGSIHIKKQTNPDGATQSFAFTTTGGLTPSTFNLIDGGTQDFNDVAAATYTVSETAPTDPWEFEKIECTGGSTSISSRTVTITLAANDDVTCTYFNRQKPQVKLVKVLNPTTDNGLFDLTIGATTFTNSGNGFGHNGTTGFVTVDPNPTLNVSEAGHTGTALTDYVSKVECDSGKGSADPGTSLNISVTYGDKVTCTFTNNRKPQVKVVKLLSPTSDTGKFDLRIQDAGGTTTFDNSATGFGHNGTTGFVNVAVGSITVSELAHTGTSLTDYTSKVECDSSKGSTDPGTSRTFTVAYGDKVTCNITNTRRNFTVIVLVCEGSSLYSSSVTMDGVTKNSLPSSTTPTDAVLCALGGARYTGLVSGDQPAIDVDIGLLEL